MYAIQEQDSVSDFDFARRRELRTFLMECRSRVDPVEMGLPFTRRRRVRGLRRGEVAELVGVTVDWYRHLESGRPIRVSPQFIARLGKALRLTPREEVMLFRLALPEMYTLPLTFADGAADERIQTCP